LFAGIGLILMGCALGKVRKAIGFDSGAKDCMRYAEAAGNAHDDTRYEYIYPSVAFRRSCWRCESPGCLRV
jgi:hypothetical protein